MGRTAAGGGVRLNRYRYWLAVVAAVSLLAGSAHAGGLPEAHDLAAVAASAGSRPILIEIAQAGCPYCEAVREDFLEPMIISGDYRERVVMLQLHKDSPRKIRDFDGRWIEPARFAARYHVALTPTVVLLAPDGTLLTPPLVGLTSPDFYGAFLDEAIDRAGERLRTGLTDAAPLHALRPRVGG